ncbi:hypothetical protein BSKO_12365 [Bryopsis sp. KO-2023]|nr:hypothetical protein BSKO_12365 [Bryopsis sp. KO-2023]
MLSISSTCRVAHVRSNAAPRIGAAAERKSATAFFRCPQTLRPVREVRNSRTIVAAKKQTFGSFDEMIQGSDTPVLVDFYATWCGPCQMIVPELATVSTWMKGVVKVVKIDTEKYPNLASRYDIQALPTLVLFKDGQPIDRMEGFLTGQQMADRITYMLNGAASRQ